MYLGSRFSRLQFTSQLSWTAGTEVNEICPKTRPFRSVEATGCCMSLKLFRSCLAFSSIGVLQAPILKKMGWLYPVGVCHMLALQALNEGEEEASLYDACPLTWNMPVWCFQHACLMTCQSLPSWLPIAEWEKQLPLIPALQHWLSMVAHGIVSMYCDFKCLLD